MRGSVPRVHTIVIDQNRGNNKSSTWFVILNRRAITVDMNRIDIYSERKIITNGTDLYSVLNPLTNSDSPSEKSKGDRLVSAIAVIYRMNMTGNIKRDNGPNLICDMVK